MLREIEKSGFSKCPKLLGWGSGFDNCVGFPYLVSEWIEGRPAEWSDDVPRERGVRDRFLRQLGESQMELVECSRKDCEFVLFFGIDSRPHC